MSKALHRAKISPTEIDYVNAHGTGTPLNDITEALALRSVFGSSTDALPVSSIKGAIGHAMAAAGALELAACVLALGKQVAPGTMNLSVPDPQIALNVLRSGAHAMRLRRVMSNSFGFGGHNAVVILEAP
jgi:3-oxoacyl-[acyl-carrier-protein] synthase II